jgi:hypothetical protein
VQLKEFLEITTEELVKKIKAGKEGPIEQTLVPLEGREGVYIFVNRKAERTKGLKISLEEIEEEICYSEHLLDKFLSAKERVYYSNIDVGTAGIYKRNHVSEK